jgi:hypothetical protein
MKMDSKRRCGAMLIYDTKMVVLPFNTQNYLDDEDMELEGYTICI